MKVYRVEHAWIKSEEIDWACGPFQDETIRDGLERTDWRKVGPYLRAAKKIIDHMGSDFDRYPTPWADPLLNGVNRSELCGVSSKEAVADWFGDSLPILCDCGFRIREYEVPDEYCRIGSSNQVLFVAKYAKETGDFGVRSA